MRFRNMEQINQILRVEIELDDITEIFVDSGFKIFADQISKNEKLKYGQFLLRQEDQEAFVIK